ncbi:MAG: MotA/TolQ/ExbB proton channel family protein [Treponema sp.]
MKLIEFINLGGPLNWVLAAVLCFCFCQCLERSIYFFQTRKGSKNDALKRLHSKAAALSKLPETQRQKELMKESTILYYEMNRGLWLLNVISAVSPSIGLLGTVTGLIGSFAKMAEAGAAVNIQDLSGGIWEAMLTTAFGMIISIPAVLCYRMFKRIIEKRMMYIELYAEEHGEAAREKEGDR